VNWSQRETAKKVRYYDHEHGEGSKKCKWGLHCAAAHCVWHRLVQGGTKANAYALMRSRWIIWSPWRLIGQLSGMKNGIDVA